MLWITQVQRYCLHDGPGIRSTVFFKGCPLKCAWCHNPETQAFGTELMRHEARCTGCGACETICGEREACVPCTGCGRCVGACPAQAREVVGRALSPDALSDLLLRDRAFYDRSGGGVTLSGGELLAQPEAALLELLRRLQRHGVHVLADTCGHAPWARLEALLPYIQGFLYDFKAFSPITHAHYTGVDNGLILDNLCRLSRAGADVALRIPVIPEVNVPEMPEIIHFVRQHVNVSRVHLLPYHRLGSDKRARLGEGGAMLFTEPEDAAMQTIARQWQAAGFEQVVIGG